MTKRELKGHIREFVFAQDDTLWDEWYCTDQDISRYVMSHFLAWMNLEDEVGL